MALHLPQFVQPFGKQKGVCRVCLAEYRTGKLRSGDRRLKSRDSVEGVKPMMRHTTVRHNTLPHFAECCNRRPCLQNAAIADLAFKSLTTRVVQSISIVICRRVGTPPFFAKLSMNNEISQTRQLTRIAQCSNNGKTRSSNGMVIGYTIRVGL